AYSDPVQYEMPMLIDNVEPVEPPQVHRFPIRSLVGLYRLDLSDGFSRNATAHDGCWFCETGFGVVLGLLPLDGKLGGLVGLTPIQPDQLPCKMVERGSEVVGEVAEDPGPAVRD